MKNLLFYLVFACTALFGLSSCSSQQENDPISSESALLTELSRFNQSLLKSIPETRLSKREFLEIATADVTGAFTGGEAGSSVGRKIGFFLGNPITGSVFGAAVGALAFGTYSSWLASPDEPNDDSQYEAEDVDFETIINIYDEYVGLAETNEIAFESEEVEEAVMLDEDLEEAVELEEEEMEVGMMHNILLAGLEGDLVEVETSFITRSSLDNDQQLEYNILHSSEMENVFNELCQNQAHFDNSLPSSVMNLFSSIFQVFPENGNDVVYLINTYHRMVEQSNELSQDEKQWIYMGLAVSLYSFNYWNKRLN